MVRLCDCLPSPGIRGLWALGYHVEEIRGWLGSSQAAGTEVGGFLFVVLASVGLGVFLSGVRYFLFDRFLFGWVGSGHALRPTCRQGFPMPSKWRGSRRRRMRRFRN